jgi:4-hydroxybenzoate polyprenyltransferase
MLRFNNWWSIIIPQILGWIYFCELTADRSFLIADWGRVLLFVLGVISIASFGYVLNDYCDIESDKISGKKNSLSKVNRPMRNLIVSLPLILGIASWALLHSGIIANVLYGLQILALIIYSAPPVRLKERSVLGIAADAFYGHVNPAFFTIFTFIHWSNAPDSYTVFLLVLVFVCTSIKGVRNILLHQIDDRKKDHKARLNTFVVKYGAYFSLLLINRLLPFELFFTILLVVIISIKIPPFFLFFLIFIVITYLKFSGWKLSYLPKRQLKFKFLYFINDFYEGWMPVVLLIILCSRTPVFLFLLLLNFILFPLFIVQLWKDVKTIQQNFKTENDY